MQRAALVIIIVCLLVAPCPAALQVVGRGDSMCLDPSGFPPAIKANYEIFKSKCVRCHSMEWTIVALRTGIAPLSGLPFDQNYAKAYGVKMLRKPDSKMTKEDVRAAVELLTYLIDESAR
jgi:hypothetical protein